MATRKEQQKQEEKAMQVRREIWGVALIALGVFLGVCVYALSSGILGETVTDILFGLFGLFTFALPAAVAVAGVLLIAMAGSKPRKGRVLCSALGVFFLLAIMHLTKVSLLGEATYLSYISDAYDLGQIDHMGGGAIGAILLYPVLHLTGVAGSYIFLIAGILIVLLIITRISLKQTSKRAAQGVKHGVKSVQTHMASRQALYTESLAEEDIIPKRKPKPFSAKRPVQGGPVIADNSRPDVDFIPSEGKIDRRVKKQKGEKLGDLRDPFNEEAVQEKPSLPLEPELPVIATPVKVADAKAESSSVPVFRYDPKAEASKAPTREETAEWANRVVRDVPYVAPSFGLLNAPNIDYEKGGGEAPELVGEKLIETLKSFNVQATLLNICVGPVITRFELQPARGVRVNKFTVLSDDIALALAAPRVRIEAPIPGKSAVGVEIPNKNTAMVVLRDVLESRLFQSAESPITMGLGKDIAGNVMVADLAKMPHLLIAGATGAGKSVCINDIIISLIYKSSPKELQLILVDPKVVELTSFARLPHLKLPVVTEPKKAAGALIGAVKEMTDRYEKFAKVGARDLARYNDLQEDENNKLPKLVIIIDELADLMMVAPDTVEDSICRIAQLGRACGIHLIVATQRPSADIITGLIKANIPSRIAFAVSSAIDSRIILDAAGAEKLLGRGDMLFHANGSGKPVRCQGAFVSDEEVERIAKHFEAQMMEPVFDESLIADIAQGDASSSASANTPNEDELLGEAVRIIIDSGQASISMIQRRLRVGYARAARLVDIMERHGYVSGFDGSKPRKLLITRAQYESIFGEGAQASTIMDEPQQAQSSAPPVQTSFGMDSIPAGTLYGTTPLVKPIDEEAKKLKPLDSYADDDPDAPWARKDGEKPPWEEEGFDD